MLISLSLVLLSSNNIEIYIYIYAIIQHQPTQQDTRNSIFHMHAIGTPPKPRLTGRVFFDERETLTPVTYSIMIAIQRVNKTRYSPNILPCRINHDGPVNAHARYWSPKTEPDGTRTTYVRGRQLRGRVMRLPKGYSGTEIVASCVLANKG